MSTSHPTHDRGLVPAVLYDQIPCGLTTFMLTLEKPWKAARSENFPTPMRPLFPLLLWPGLARRHSSVPMNVRF
jgi:hypothetical protein